MEAGGQRGLQDGMLLHKCIYAVNAIPCQEKDGIPPQGGIPARDGIHGLYPNTHLSLILIRAQTSDVNPQHDGAVGDSSPILLPDSGILESKRRPGWIIQ